MLRLNYNNIDETKLALKNFITNSQPIDRYNFIKSLRSDDEFKKFYKFITKHRLATLFKCGSICNLSSLYTNGNYLNYMYIMFMSNPYEIDFNSFFDFYNLNETEKDYINNLFYIDMDYKEHIKPQQFIRNIIDNCYTVDDVYNYVNLKFKDKTNCGLFKKVKHIMCYLKNHPNTIKMQDSDLNNKISFLFKNGSLTNYYPMKTSPEPVIGLARSSITSPTQTTAKPLTKTSVEPVIDTESCDIPEITSVCFSHLSPTRTTAKPLTKTSVEPVIDFLGGKAGGCPEQTSPIRTTGFGIDKLFI